MFRLILIHLTAVILLAGIATGQNTQNWRIDSTEEWQQAEKESEGLTFDAGLATPTGAASCYRSVMRTFGKKHSATSILLRQSPVWQNWTPVANIGPSNLKDAPVLLTIGPGNYWMFGRYGSGQTEGFQPEDAELEGFDIPLKTTSFPNQFDAPGGLKGSLGGYHAWQSKDMINWVHHGPVTEKFSSWVTTAEYVDGNAYIYYDFPNDQDPHLYIDGDLTDGKPGKNMGLAFKDPSDGSDCTFIRDLQGQFHVIYEDWSPINASTHAWDSPLAGHAVSPDGKGAFKILSPPIDDRTHPTGKFAEYAHPHWNKEDPEHFPAKQGTDRAYAKYEVHEPEQNAYGDYAAISIGGQYYLFCDYHPAGKEIRVAWFTAPDVNKPFTFCGELGLGHPDPDIGFADGKFYLVTQTPTDYISPGPWVDGVQARVGVDTTKDGKADIWTDWADVQESYDYIKGFSKQIKRIPASLDLSKLPAGFGFCFEVRTKTSMESKAKPILDSVIMSFEELSSLAFAPGKDTRKKRVD